jgi:hypothetical protein
LVPPCEQLLRPQIVPTRHFEITHPGAKLFLEPLNLTDVRVDPTVNS